MKWTSEAKLGFFIVIAFVAAVLLTLRFGHYHFQPKGSYRIYADFKSVETRGSDLSPDVLEFFVNNGTKKSRKSVWERWSKDFKARNLKILFKCSMAVWIMTLFIFINATLRVLGQAAFFGW